MGNEIVLPSDLLFKLPLGKDDKSLFKTKADLARSIKEFPGSEFSGRTEESIRSYLSQVFKPDADIRSRPLSRNLESAILDACKIRLNSTQDIDDFRNKLDRAFKTYKKASVLKERNENLNELYSAESNAKCHSIFTFEPAELIIANSVEKEGYKLAYQQRNAMIEALNLRKDLKNNVNEFNSIKVRYEFFVPKKIIAEELWDTIYDNIYSYDKSDFIDINLKLVNDKKFLSIYVVNPVYCCIPTVVFDPKQSSRRGFQIHHHEDDNDSTEYVSIAEMSKDSLGQWYEHVYRADDTKENPIEWNTVKEKCIR
jgi:hypothetical protein